MEEVADVVYYSEVLFNATDRHLEASPSPAFASSAVAPAVFGQDQLRSTPRGVIEAGDAQNALASGLYLGEVLGIGGHAADRQW